MAQLTIKGVYKNGKIELADKPRGLDNMRVMVTFLPEELENATVQSKAADRLEAGKQMLEMMRAGIDFGTEKVKFNREEIYEDRIIELDARRARH